MKVNSKHNNIEGSEAKYSLRTSSITWVGRLCQKNPNSHVPWLLTCFLFVCLYSSICPDSGLVSFMTEGPIMAVELLADNAVGIWRKTIGGYGSDLGFTKIYNHYLEEHWVTTGQRKCWTLSFFKPSLCMCDCCVIYIT